MANPGSGDTVTIDAASGSGTITVNTNFNITSLTCGAMNTTLDFSANNNSPTMNTFDYSGTGTRTINMGSGTWSIAGNNTTIWQATTQTNLTFSGGSSTVNFTYSGSTGTRTFTFGGATSTLGTVNITGGSDAISQNNLVCGSLSYAGYTGTLTLVTNGTNCSGNLTLGTGMTFAQVNPTLTLTSSTTCLITSNGVQIQSPLTINGTGTFTLADAISVGGTSTKTFTFTAGTFDAANFNVTTAVFSSTNTNVRTLTMGSGTWTLTGNNTTIWQFSTQTNLTLNAGTSTLLCNYSGATGTRTLNIGQAGINNLRITGGTDTITMSANSLFIDCDFTGFTGSWTSSSFTCNGNFTLGTGMTVTGGSNVDTFSPISGTKVFRSNGVIFDRPVTINATVGAGIQLFDALSMDNGTARTLTLTQGTFNANNFNVTCGAFSSSNSNTRVLTMGSGTWALTGNAATIWSMATVTNLTITDARTVNCTYSGATGTRTISVGNANINLNFPSFNFTAGTDIVAITSATATGSVDFTGFAGTYSNVSHTCYGSMTFSTGMTVSGGAGTLTMVNETGSSHVLISNGKTLDFNITKTRITSLGGILTLGDALTLGATNTFTLTFGTFNTANFNASVGLFSSSNSNTRTLTLGSSTITLTGTGTVWNTSTITGLTLLAGTSTIVMNDASSSSKTFAGGALTYYNITMTGAGTGTFIMGTTTATMTLNNWTVDTPPHTVQVFAGKTINVNSLTWSGTSTDANTFQSTTNGTAWFLVSRSEIRQDENYISLQDSHASPDSIFYAGTNSTNVSNNTGWSFIKAPRKGGVPKAAGYGTLHKYSNGRWVPIELFFRNKKVNFRVFREGAWQVVD